VLNNSRNRPRERKINGTKYVATESRKKNTTKAQVEIRKYNTKENATR